MNIPDKVLKLIESQSLEDIILGFELSKSYVGIEERREMLARIRRKFWHQLKKDIEVGIVDKTGLNPNFIIFRELLKLYNEI